ncbi:MAG: folate-binding protein, partial [Oricola sp.]|nr:folate-binding protein [Oricola sp.]
ADYGAGDVFSTDVNHDRLSGIDYKKGCFVGQEVSSRMKRKGEARRRTLVADFEGAPPPKGSPVTAGDSTLGEIMSGADGVALAAIRLDRWEKARTEEIPVECGGRELRLRIPAYLEQG